MFVSTHLRTTLVAAVIGAVGGIAVAAGAVPAAFDDSPSGPGDVSGPCDEAEHAADPRCAGVTVAAPAPVSDPAPVTDVSGPCDEAEHAADPRCAGVGNPEPPSTTVTAPTTTTTDGAATEAPPTTVSVPATVAPGDGGVVMAAGAGSVAYSVEGSTLRVLDVTVAEGWRAVVERSSGVEIEVSFRAGTRRVDVHVEFDDGAVRERVRIRDRADDSRTRTDDGVVVGSGDPGHDDSGGSGHGRHGRSDDDRRDDDSSDDGHRGRGRGGHD